MWESKSIGLSQIARFYYDILKFGEDFTANKVSNCALSKCALVVSGPRAFRIE